MRSFIIASTALILMAAAHPSPSPSPAARLDDLLSSKAQRRARLLLELRLLDMRRAKLTCAEAVVRRQLQGERGIDISRACDYSQKRE